MDLTLSVYGSVGRHKLTVIARPHAAAALGEFVLIEGRVLDVEDEPSAQQVLRAAYLEIAAELAARSRSE